MKIKEIINTYITRLKGEDVVENLASYDTLVTEIFEYNKSMQDKSDHQLGEIADSIRKAVTEQTDLDNFLIEIYSLVIEAFKRKLGITPYKVQVLAAIVLNKGTILEMQTGEGKTIVAVFSACLNALSKRGVHILTFNEYLARRDARWMKDIYMFLGFSVAYIQENMDNEEKRIAYNCDITYSTAKQVGFDFLQSSMAYQESAVIIRDFHYVIVDEADAILIDEARNPLVLAGNFNTNSTSSYEIHQFISGLKEGIDFHLDEYHRNVFLTEEAMRDAEQYFSVVNLHSSDNVNLLTGINLALQARTLLQKDIDYIVEDNEIRLIDEFTGRIMEDRKWQNGLQSAVEIKEGLNVQSEGTILNTISLPHLIRLYSRISGMTGTAKPSKREFADVYHLKVTIIPPNKPSQRKDLPNIIYTGKKEKVKAIVNEVKRIKNSGRPVLIGTLTVKESEELEKEIRSNEIDCVVLNAKNDEYEASVIENAGLLGAVTISTNMAGRGTDIMLGGVQQVNREEIVALGGLHIIATNLHESCRIDQQLRGRSGRQGDPGSSQFIISFEDDLMVRYNLKSLLPKKFRNIISDTPVHIKAIDKSIALEQRIIEGQLYEQRKTLYNYSSFIELHRKIYFERRTQLLFNPVKTMSESQKEQQLLHFDYFWSNYLADITTIKEGIYLERMAGRSPLAEFCKRADELFKQLMEKLDNTVNEVTSTDTIESGFKKPSSTWTYVVNDNPFKNQFVIKLIQLSNFKF